MTTQGGGAAESAAETIVEKGIHLKFMDHETSPYFSGISPDWQPPLNSLSSNCWAAIPLIVRLFFLSSYHSPIPPS
jgi:hypothetical protein